jgi:hypothetical protein
MPQLISNKIKCLLGFHDEHLELLSFEFQDKNNLPEIFGCFLKCRRCNYSKPILHHDIVYAVLGRLFRRIDAAVESLKQDKQKAHKNPIRGPNKRF